MPPITDGSLLMLILSCCLALISAVSAGVTVYDKWAAVHRPGKRIRESSLLALAVVGGSAAMLLTMLLIRHKTRHPKFMVGIPLILAIQIALVYVAVRYMDVLFVL